MKITQSVETIHIIKGESLSFGLREWLRLMTSCKIDCVIPNPTNDKQNADEYSIVYTKTEL